jgi:hypothetical protein
MDKCGGAHRSRRPHDSVVGGAKRMDKLATGGIQSVDLDGVAEQHLLVVVLAFGQLEIAS